STSPIPWPPRKSATSSPSPPPAWSLPRPTTSTSTSAAWSTSSTAMPVTTSWSSIGPSAEYDLIGPCARIFYDFRPFRNFAGDVVGELLRRAGRDLGAEGRQAVLQVFLAQ